MNAEMENYLMGHAVRTGRTALMAHVRLLAILRDDRERTRPRWTFAGVHPSGKLRAYYCCTPLNEMAPSAAVLEQRAAWGAR